MKTRKGFVSNSSSASFIVQRKFLSPVQEAKIRDCQTTAEEILETVDPSSYLAEALYYFGDPHWNIEWSEDAVGFDTDMDNFDMKTFLLEIGVPEEAIEPN